MKVKTSFEFRHQYDSFMPVPMNWRDFTIIHLDIETSKCVGRIFEVTFALLGIYITFGLWDVSDEQTKAG